MSEFTMSKFASTSDMFQAMQARIDELESALESMYENFHPRAWGSKDNKRDALIQASAALREGE